MARLKRVSLPLLIILLTISLIACGGSPTMQPSTTPSETQTKPSAGPTTQVPTSSSTIAQLQVSFINVGQGDAILIDYGTVEVLIDGGETSSGVVPYLRKYVDGGLEAMVATHPHADHIGGLIDVLRSFQVDSIYWNGEVATTKVYSDFMALAKAEPGALLQQLKRGDSISVSGLTFSVLNPPSPLFKDTNNNSIVLKLKQGDIQFLFEGDAEQEAESSILAAGLNVDADILKVGHHGSRSSSSMPFLKAVSPPVAVYMVGINNSYGHPHAETITALNGVGAQVYGTDLHGTIIVTTDGQKYTLNTEIPGSPRAPPTSTPTLTPTPTTPSPTTELTLEIVSVTSPVGPGYSATLVAKTTPGANCGITVYYNVPIGLTPQGALIPLQVVGQLC